MKKRLFKTKNNYSLNELRTIARENDFDFVEKENLTYVLTPDDTYVFIRVIENETTYWKLK